MAVPCIVKCIFSPFILLYHSIRIYFCGCLCTYVGRFFKHLCCGLCVCCGCRFTDNSFPPNSMSIGPWKGKSVKAIDHEVVWRRLGELFAHAGHQGVQLFAGEVEAADICQGQLGDCWLLSAAACLAKYEGAIQRCFLTREYYAYGRYTVRLFNRPTNRWVSVIIDDWIPCSRQTGEPIFARPQGNEGWVLLLEKAFAKMRGSYAALEGGCTLEALEALTGDQCFECRYDTAKRAWFKWDLVHVPRKKNTPPQVLLQLSQDKQMSSDQMFETMRLYNKRQSVIAASSGSGNDAQNIDGIVQGHAYAVCRVKEVEGLRLLQLRNPWGTFEWRGNWSDHSPLWKQHPKVAKVLRHEAAEDGCFWMAWEDFRRHFSNIDFCCRTTGWDDLVLDIHEECACIGPCVGCVEGCAYFWCACAGPKALFFARDTQTDLVRKPSGCGCLP